ICAASEMLPLEPLRRSKQSLDRILSACSKWRSSISASNDRVKLFALAGPLSNSLPISPKPTAYLQLDTISHCDSTMQRPNTKRLSNSIQRRKSRVAVSQIFIALPANPKTHSHSTTNNLPPIQKTGQLAPAK